MTAETGAALPFGLAVVGPPPAPRPGEVVGVVVARNEALRLGAALREVRRLGIGPVIVIDNLSTDETRAVAAGFDRVHLVEAPESYAGSGFGIAWINAVLDRWARGHWALMFDADEVLVFPGSDRPAALPRLCGHLDSLGSECLRVVMLDLFPQAPLARVAYRPEQSLPEAAAWFEPPRLRREAAPHFPFEAEYGGVRERLFFPEADPSRLLRRAYQRAYNLGWRLPWLRRSARFQALAPKRSPNMTKVPLVRWREGVGFVTAHSLSPVAVAPEQPSGVLLHFKFLQDFHARVLDAVARDAHFDGSAEYRRYLAALRRDPEFSLHGPRSLHYESPDQLVGLGLMRDTAAWRTARGA
ncbi:glycosyltransferase family 2 protein [Paeniroseomonas aquatica]|uniref:Glycosyltransferase family 2 protein n=1 Tax=Paeniroseomonas aquatica TaxID=373043 RepID=A0ABT8A5W5_9PROT|nr:glycosyltransferase family 2 protein [Paeniroseomonas aquatica]MDN3565068.1 glycosyltransferase family 2 protein [Paeniroseomonas aquatica]